MIVCDVTGRIFRTPAELTVELARIDDLLRRMRAIVDAYTDMFKVSMPGGIPTADIGDAFNAASDALDALEQERACALENPAPIPAAEAATYRLVQDNMD